MKHIAKYANNTENHYDKTIVDHIDDYCWIVEPSICFIYRVLVFAYHVASEQALLIQGVRVEEERD